MKTITELKSRKWFSGIHKNQGNIFGIFLYLVLFTGASLIYNSCAGGYVVTEPSYDEVYSRPASPGFGYVWIDGDWLWNYHTHAYVHEHGYWSSPKSGHSYESGHWESEPRGKYWVKGHWQRENQSSSFAHDHYPDRDHDRR